MLKRAKNEDIIINQFINAACSEAVQNLQASCHEDHEFSETFKAKLRELIRTTRKKNSRNAMRSIAAIFLLITMCASLLMYTDPEVHAAIARWIREVRENSIIYRYPTETEAETNSLPKMRPSVLPEGYVEVDWVDMGNIHIVLFRNDADPKHDIVLEYYVRTSTTQTQYFNSANFETRKLFVNSNEAYLHIDLSGSSANEIIWILDAYDVVCKFSAFENGALLIAMAESVAPVVS